MKRLKAIIILVVISSSVAAQTNSFPSSGNVGIGTTSPSVPLEILGSNSSNSIPVGISVTNTHGSGKAQLGAYNNNGVGVGLTVFGSSFGAGLSNSSVIGGNVPLVFMTDGDYPSGGTSPISFRVGGYDPSVERMRITPSGNIGIGTTSPAALLDIQGNNSSGIVGARVTNGHATGGALFNAYNDAGKTLGVGIYGSSYTADLANKGIVGGNVPLVFMTDGDFPSGGTSPISFRIGGYDASTERMRITSTGNVGIGRTDPQTKLDINTTASIDGFQIRHNNDAFVRMHSTSLSAGSWNPLTRSGDAGIIFGEGGDPGDVNFGFMIAPWRSEGSGIRIDRTGNVGIGTYNTSDANFKLFVETGIRTRKVKVDQVSWADYVFEKNYRLPTLAEVEAFIQRNKHLPEMPSAAEVEKNGLNLGDNQALLLKKIEELTLYIIEQNKRIEKLEKQVSKGK